jgi:hypothetical protein
VLDITAPLEVTPGGNTEVDEILAFGIQGVYIPNRFDHVWRYTAFKLQHGT